MLLFTNEPSFQKGYYLAMHIELQSLIIIICLQSNVKRGRNFTEKFSSGKNDDLVGKFFLPS